MLTNFLLPFMRLPGAFFGTFFIANLITIAGFFLLADNFDFSTANAAGIITAIAFILLGVDSWIYFKKYHGRNSG